MRSTRQDMLEEMHPWPLPVAAGHLRRFASFAVDFLLLYASGWLMGIVVWVVFSPRGRLSEWLHALARMPGEWLGIMALWMLAWLLSWWGYFVLLRASCGQTCGERIWGVCLMGTGGFCPGFGRCLVRGLGALVSLLCAGAGFWMSFWDSRGRTWHDRWSRTLLVQPWPGRFWP